MVGRKRSAGLWPPSNQAEDITEEDVGVLFSDASCCCILADTCARASLRIVDELEHV